MSSQTEYAVVYEGQDLSKLAWSSDQAAAVVLRDEQKQAGKKARILERTAHYSESFPESKTE